jgi:predicted site-specific integrase-resolvase
MLRPEEAAHIARISPRLIYQWVEAGRLHFKETPDGSLFVCLASLPAGKG